MNSSQATTLLRIYERPMRSDIRFTEVESLLASLGCELTPGRGSHLRVVKRDENGTIIARMSFMRPHRPPHFQRYALRDLRTFLDTIGIGPEETK